jgi:hypothetical protein
VLQPVADGCRPSRPRLSACLLLDAAHCCWLLPPLSRPLRTTRTRPSKHPPANFLALARRPKRLPGPLSLIFTTGPAILRYVLHSSTSTSTTRSLLLFFLPAHSRIPTHPDPLITTSATRRSVVVVQSRAVPFSQATLFAGIFVW